ncbi:uncharacterized protein LOC143465812 isoform X1 [Clavelina lepadiformis]|uniref:uncharacterized protein LOC143465812 isoform X1 n=1 Tax=Clavelina lepadiformis TaxID=159417 RepID=UPI0040424DC4
MNCGSDFFSSSVAFKQQGTMSTSAQDKVKCPICWESFKAPIRMLACSHNFCHVCLEKLCGNSNNIYCPTCRAIAVLDCNGVEGIPRNRALENVITTFEPESPTFSKEQAQVQSKPSTAPIIPPKPEHLRCPPEFPRCPLPNFLPPELRLPADEWQNKNWYFGDMTRAEAEKLLRNCICDGSYLIRNSASVIGRYTLSVKTSHDRIMHFPVTHQEKDQVLVIRGMRKPFHSMECLIRYFMTNNLDRCGEGQVFLTQPPFKLADLVSRSFT